MFTLALLPADEPSLRHFIGGAVPALGRVGISATNLVERTSAAVYDILNGRSMSLEPLGVAIAGRLEYELTPDQAIAWRSPSWYAKNQRLGEAIVHFALYIVALKGVICMGMRERGKAMLVRTDQWLRTPPSVEDRASAGSELVRRYLRCYGPSTEEDLARWAGIHPQQARHLWQLIEPELVLVQFDGRSIWLHADDIARFERPSDAEGVRLLPPHDPYLDQRDRHVLLPQGFHREVWRAVGNPGVVLANGQLVATWRANKRGKRLQMAIKPFSPLSRAQRDEIEIEAQGIAPYRGCQSTDLEFAT